MLLLPRCIHLRCITPSSSQEGHAKHYWSARRALLLHASTSSGPRGDQYSFTPLTYTAWRGLHIGKAPPPSEEGTHEAPTPTEAFYGGQLDNSLYSQ